MSRAMKTTPHCPTTNSYEVPLQPNSSRSHSHPPSSTPDDRAQHTLLCSHPSVQNSSGWASPELPSCRSPSTRTLNEPDNDKFSSDIQSLVNNASTESIHKLSIPVPPLPLLPSVDQSGALNTEPDHPNIPSSLVDLKLSVLKRGHFSAPPKLSSPTFVENNTVRTAPFATPFVLCTVCRLPIHGAFVRALGAVYHLDCFKCIDCGEIVASKFFPFDGPEDKQQPLCERDYFRRIDLLCARCDMALRGSYITACFRKYHIEHFTCSICAMPFGPQDSYHEEDNDIYCHYHYSTRFAIKCIGCKAAILKQFRKDMRDECWHPECYMINKSWNAKTAPLRRAVHKGLPSGSTKPPYAEEEAWETRSSLREKQTKMGWRVSRIWTVLSVYEGSSTACISDTLWHVSNGEYLEAIQMAEKFVLHVEVLFGTIEDAQWHFAQLSIKGVSHVSEARTLCHKTVEFFTLLARTHHTSPRWMGISQELLGVVPRLAHYLKILIRVALTSTLKLERDYGVREAVNTFLDKLHLLSVQGANPSARRMVKRANGDVVHTPRQTSGNPSTFGVMYGFSSLTPENAGESPLSYPPRDPVLSIIPVPSLPSDLCIKCNSTIEEDCVRLVTYERWHSSCVQCKICGKVAAQPLPTPTDNEAQVKEKQAEISGPTPKVQRAHRHPPNLDHFVYEMDSFMDTESFGAVPGVIYCMDHAHQGCRGGFQAVSPLEQFAYLLNVALRRLFLLLKQRGVIATMLASPPTPSLSPSEEQDPGHDFQEISHEDIADFDSLSSSITRSPKRSILKSLGLRGRVGLGLGYRCG